MSTRSAFCQFAVHDRCTGTAAGDPCSCTCHHPATEPDRATVPGHCPTCTCPPPCP